MKRRHLITGIGGVATAGIAGSFVLFGDGRTEFEASPTAVEPAARSETGYEETGVEETVVEREVGVGPLSETLVVRNYATEHEKAVEMGPLGRQRGAVFVALSTPRLGALGQDFNPVAEMSTEELVGLVQQNYDEIGRVEHDADDTAVVLGQSTTRSRFTAEATFDGMAVDVDLHVTEAVETDDDHVVSVGVYPRYLRSTEAENVLELAESITADAPDDTGDESDPDSGDDDGTNESGDEGSTTDGDNESTTAGDNESTTDGDGGIDVGSLDEGSGY